MGTVKVNSWQNQVICGSLLGAGYVSRTRPPYMGMSEGRVHDWLRYKGAELEEVGARTPLCASGKVLKWRSASGEVWGHYARMFYGGGGKRVGMETLNSLRDVALAVWFGDKGFWYSKRMVGLRTTAFGAGSNRTIGRYFNEVGMPCELKEDSNGATRVVFTREGTGRFLATVAHRLPPFMYGRLSPPDSP